ncbi:MAG: LamG domain-containing protein [Planctomycetota bacterium]|jgi:hypothetical protein
MITTTQTQISNIFNLMVQVEPRLLYYHFGWRSDILKNIDNNFDEGNLKGRQFPALHFSVPEFTQYIGGIDYTGVKEEMEITLYFDDLQYYENDGSANSENLIEEWAGLKQIAEDYIANLDNVISNKYLAGSISKPKFEQFSNGHNDRLITWRVTFILTHVVPCTEEDNIIDLDSLPPTIEEADLENWKTIPPPCFSFLFDGINKTIDCGNNAAFNIDSNTPFSFAGWIKPSSFAILNFIMSKFSGSIGWEFTLLSGRIRMLMSSGAGGGANKIVADGTTVLPLNVWSFVALTFDGSNSHTGVNIYIDSVLDIKSQSVGGPLAGTMQTANNLQIGGQAGFFFAGNIAPILAWNVELTPAEVATQYARQISDIPVQAGSLIVHPDISNSTFGAQYFVPDLTGITAGYTTLNVQEVDKVEDCPIIP